MKLKGMFGVVCDVMGAHIFHRNTPLQVKLKVTYQCDRRCTYCGIWNIKTKEMTTNQIMSCISEFAEMGTKEIMFTGGEPLMRVDIGGLVDFAKKEGLRVRMGSNGGLVSEKIEEIKNLDMLILSLDGPKRIHDKNRGAGSYDDVVEAVRIASDYGIPVVSTTVLNKDNLNDVDFILGKAEELGFYTNFQILFESPLPARGWLGGESAKSLLPNENNFKLAVQNLIDKKKKGAPIINSLPYLEFLYHNWAPDPILDSRVVKCWAGRLFCVVEPNGDVYPCSGLESIVKAINGLELGFKQAFENLDREFSCKRCYFSSYTETNLLYSLNFRSIFNAWNLLGVLGGKN